MLHTEEHCNFYRSLIVTGIEKYTKLWWGAEVGSWGEQGISSVEKLL
jgi:hypothetical protein